MLPVIKKIMIAVDFSDYTEPSVNYGISLAKDLKADLLLVNVVNSRNVTAIENFLALQEPVLFQRFVEGTFTSHKQELEEKIERKEKIEDAHDVLAQQIQKYIEDTFNARELELKKLLDMASDQGVKGEAMVRHGVPYMAILKVIKSESPDLIIVGAKGRSNLADAIVGSCAQKLYRRCPIPLLTVRHPKDIKENA